MEPLAALGAAAAASQFVDQGLKVTIAISGLYSSMRDAPDTVRHNLFQIEQLVSISKLIIQNPALQTASIQSTLSTSLGEASKLQHSLKKVHVLKAAGRVEHARKAFLAVMKEKGIVQFFANLEREKTALVLCIQEINSYVFFPSSCPSLFNIKLWKEAR
jgi:hypothetical protein